VVEIRDAVAKGLQVNAHTTARITRMRTNLMMQMSVISGKSMKIRGLGWIAWEIRYW